MTLEKHHREILEAILKKYPYKFYAFGSRVKGTAKLFSDLDLCYFEKIPLLEIAHLEEDLEESNLPFRVDLVNGSDCDEAFRQSISSDLTPVYQWLNQ